MSKEKQCPHNEIDLSIKRAYLGNRIIEKLIETKIAYSLGHYFAAEIKIKSALKLLNLALEGTIFDKVDARLLTEVRSLENMIKKKSDELDIVMDIEDLVNTIRARSTKCPKCEKFSLKPAIKDFWKCENCGYEVDLHMITLH
ncbi:MAG: hypothetical protein QXZ02_03380 [Candidatus Bathyarchaeia archaeon]